MQTAEEHLAAFPKGKFVAPPPALTKMQCGVHGSMYFPDCIVAAIDTDQVQRLRDLRQTGFLHYLYPTANHTRFEHSLGVAWNCRRIMLSLKSRQPELGIESRHVDIMTLAGLVHDLGHGPLSHLYENEIAKPDRSGRRFNHEEMSVELFEEMYPELMAVGWTTDDLSIVPIILAGDCKTIASRFGPQLGFMARLVSDKTCGADMDRLDYLKRDAKAIGIPVHFDLDKIIETARVVSGELVWPIKEAHNLQALFETRYELFLRAYRHRTVEAVDLMVVDAIKLDYDIGGCEAKSLAHDWVNTEKFLDMVDSNITNPSPASCLAKAFRRIRRRQLYVCITEVPVPDELTDETFTPDELVKAIQSQFSLLDPVKVRLCRIHYGMGPDDPFKSMKFVDDCGKLVSWSAQAAGMLIRPNRFMQTSIRVFSMSRDPAVIASIVAKLQSPACTKFMDFVPVGRSKYFE